MIGLRRLNAPMARTVAGAVVAVVLIGTGVAVAKTPAPVFTVLGMAGIAALAFQVGYRSLLFALVSRYYLIPIPGVSFIVYWGDLATIALIAGWALRLLAGRERVPRYPWLFAALLTPLAIYWGHVIAGRPVTDAVVASVRQFEFAGMLLMLISYLHPSERRLAWYVRASLILGVIGSALGIILATDYSARYGLLLDVAPSMSLYVGFYLFAVLAWADARLTWRRAAVAAGVGVLFTVSVLSSMSRNLFVVLAIGLMAFLVLRPGRLKTKAVIFGFMIIAAGGVLLVSPANLTSRITDIWTDPALSRPDQTTSSGISFRFASWKMAALMWRDHPIAGVGPRAWPAFHDEYLAKLGVDPTKLDSAIFDKQAGAHSEFFQNLAEGGLLGVIAAWGAYLLAFGYSFFDWRARRRTAVEPYFRAAFVCAGMLVWSYVLGGVTEVYRFAVVPLAIPFILRALPEYRRMVAKR